MCAPPSHHHSLSYILADEMAIANRKKEERRKGGKEERRKGGKEERRARAKTNKITRLSGVLRPFWWRRDDLVIGERGIRPLQSCGKTNKTRREE